MKKIVMTVGIPGSGKTYWANNYVSENEGCTRVSKDDIRAEMRLETGKKRVRENKVVASEEEHIRQFLRQSEHHTLILDNTHLNPVHFSRIQGIVDNEGVECKIETVYFDDSLNVDMCLARNAKRDEDKYVPHDVIYKMHEQYWRIYAIRNGVRTPYNLDGELAIIVDIDGTVADKLDRSPHDYSKVIEDGLHYDVAGLIGLIAARGLRVVFLSGRDASCEEDTRKWLDQYFGHLGGYDLFMRAEGDRRKDYLVKYELFRDCVLPKYNTGLVLDDREQVVRMWRGIGLRCLQVANGDF